MAAAGARELRGGAHDALDLGHRVDAQVGGAGRIAALLPEVDPAGQLAHEDEVHPLDHLALERGGIREGGVDAHGPQVRVGAERGAQPEQSLLGTYAGLRSRPARAADGPEQHRIGLPAGAQGGRWQRVAVAVDGRTAEGQLGELELVPEAGPEGPEHPHALGNDFRPDPVTGQHRDAGLHARAS